MTLLPKMSLSPPEAGMKAAEARPYALPIHMKSGPSRSLTIVGKAVPTLVSSRALRKSAVDVPTNNKPVLRCAKPIDDRLTHEIQARIAETSWCRDTPLVKVRPCATEKAREIEHLCQVLRSVGDSCRGSGECYEIRCDASGTGGI